MKIACLQIQLKESLKKSFDYTVNSIKTDEVYRKTNILVLPDFSGDDNSLFASNDEKIEYLSSLQQIAKLYNLIILSGAFYVKSNDKFAKHVYLIDDNGNIVFYRITSKNEKVQFNIVDTKYGKIGVLFNDEIWISELSRIYSLKGAEILLVPGRLSPLQLNQKLVSLWGLSALNCIIISLCSLSDNEQHRYIGNSIITSPREILCQAKCNEEIIIAQIEDDFIAIERTPDLSFKRTLWWNLWSRKPEMYQYLKKKTNHIQ